MRKLLPLFLWAIVLQAQNWTLLLNGKNLDAWEAQGPCHWTLVPDGSILGQRDQDGSQQAWLYTKAEYSEFDLHLEYWLPTGARGGVSIRGLEIPIQQSGQWSHVDIESRNHRIGVRLNGTPVAEYADEPGHSKAGPIGLQLRDQFTFAMFRNLRIREIR